MSYDQKCYDLAVVFLSDIQNPVKHEDADALAQAIQTTIEDYLQEVEERAAAVEANTLFDQPPPALKAEMDRDMKNAIRQAKVWDEVFGSLFSSKVPR